MSVPERMPDRHARYVAVAAAAIVFAVAFALPAFRPMPVLWYYPLEHRWTFEVSPDGLAMDWFGRTLMACVLSAAVGVIVHVTARRVRPLARRGFLLWAAWMVTAVVIAMALYAHQLATRQPVPAPLPSWYTPT